MARKRKGPSGPLQLPGDNEHILEVISWALHEKLPINRPGPHHLKIGPLNYYPTKKTFNSDIAVTVKFHGFEEFKVAALAWRAHITQNLQSLWE